jgi:hypothetical protein
MKYKMIIPIISLMAIATACYEDKDPVAEIITPTGKGFYPVSANTFTDLINGSSISANRVYKPNTNIQFELQYWSESPIREINLYRTVGSTAREKIYSKPYAEVAAFSRMKSADTLVFQYTTPGTTDTSVKLEVEIVNENTLSLLRSITLQSKL